MVSSANLETPPIGTPPAKFKLGAKVLIYFKHPYMGHTEAGGSGEVSDILGWRKKDGWLYEVQSGGYPLSYISEHNLIKIKREQ